MSDVNRWIDRYIGRYIATVGPHDFPDDPEEMTCFLEGWVEAFRMARITEAEADAARVRLALHAPEFRKKHLPAVVEVVLKMRERDATQRLVEAVATPPEQARAEARARGCPECTRHDGQGPTGLALRKGVWLDSSWSASASLYCRCALGRYRLDQAMLASSEPPPFDDLQAMPHLWDWSKHHITWSERPEPPPSVEGRQWWYLAPGQDAPKMLPCVSPPSSRRGRSANRSWSGPIPENLFMPRLIEVNPPAPSAGQPPNSEGQAADEGRGAS